MTNDTYLAISHLYIFLEKCLFKFFVAFQVVYYVFLLLICKNSLCATRYSLNMFYKYLLPFWDLHFPHGLLQNTKIFSFDPVHVDYFSLIACVFWSISMKEIYLFEKHNDREGTTERYSIQWFTLHVHTTAVARPKLQSGMPSGFPRRVKEAHPLEYHLLPPRYINGKPDWKWRVSRTQTRTPMRRKHPKKQFNPLCQYPPCITTF